MLSKIIILFRAISREIKIRTASWGRVVTMAPDNIGFSAAKNKEQKKDKKKPHLTL